MFFNKKFRWRGVTEKNREAYRNVRSESFTRKKNQDTAKYNSVKITSYCRDNQTTAEHEMIFTKET